MRECDTVMDRLRAGALKEAKEIESIRERIV